MLWALQKTRSVAWNFDLMFFKESGGVQYWNRKLIFGSSSFVDEWAQPHGLKHVFGRRRVWIMQSVWERIKWGTQKPLYLLIKKCCFRGWGALNILSDFLIVKKKPHYKLFFSLINTAHVGKSVYLPNSQSIEESWKNKTNPLILSRVKNKTSSLPIKTHFALETMSVR